MKPWKEYLKMRRDERNTKMDLMEKQAALIKKNIEDEYVQRTRKLKLRSESASVFVENREFELLEDTLAELRESANCSLAEVVKNSIDECSMRQCNELRGKDMTMNVGFPIPGRTVTDLVSLVGNVPNALDGISRIIDSTNNKEIRLREITLQSEIAKAQICADYQLKLKNLNMQEKIIDKVLAREDISVDDIIALFKELK